MFYGVFEDEGANFKKEIFMDFKNNVLLSKLELASLLLHLKRRKSVSWESGLHRGPLTPINYVGLDEEIFDYHQLDQRDLIRLGTMCPYFFRLWKRPEFSDINDYALLLSWHIAEELAPKILKRQKFKGDYIIPLPMSQDFGKCKSKIVI